MYNYFYPEFCRFPIFDLLKQNGRKCGKICFLLIGEYEIYHCGLESRQFGAVLRDMFFERKWKKEINLEEPKTGTNWKRNCDVPLGISNISIFSAPTIAFLAL